MAAPGTYPLGMVIVDVALLPVRLGIIGARITVEASQWVRPDGPIRRKNGVLDAMSVILGKDGIVDQSLNLLASPVGPVAVARALTEVTSPDRPLGKALAQGGMLDALFAQGGLVDKAFAPDGFVERLISDNGIMDRLMVLLESVVRLTPTLEGIHDPLARFEAASRYLADAAEPLTDIAGKIPRPRMPRVAIPAKLRQGRDGADEAVGVVEDVPVTPQEPRRR